jgi:hypothetical protein
MAIWTSRDILDSIDEGKLRLAEREAEYEAEAQHRLDEENAKIDAAWEPIIARIRESIPEWAWDFLTYPRQMPTYRSEHVTMIRPAMIDLEGMGLVFVFADGRITPMFSPAMWYLADDDEEWSVQAYGGGSESEYSVPGNPDFLIALAQAYENMAGYAGLKAEADRRNVERQKAKVEQPATVQVTVQVVDWLAVAKTAAGPANANGNHIAAIAYALIGILEQLRLATTSLYGGAFHAIQTFDNSR